MTLDWKPIETAPKNPEGEIKGPRILAWNDYNHCITEVYWSAYEKLGTIRMGFIPIHSHLFDSQARYTHWDQKPDGPKKGK